MQHLVVLLSQSHDRAEFVYRDTDQNDELYPGKLFISAPYDHAEQEV